MTLEQCGASTHTVETSTSGWFFETSTASGQSTGCNRDDSGSESPPKEGAESEDGLRGKQMRLMPRPEAPSPAGAPE